MAGESSIGSLLGGVGGSLIGNAIAPRVGGGIGAQIGAGLGGIAGGAIESRNADKNIPQIGLEDPRQLARLREIDATRRQISEGRDPLTMQRVSEIQKMGETTKGQLGKFTGGDVGGTLSAMLRAQRNTGQGINQAYSESQNRLPFFENLSSQLSNRIEDRKFLLQSHALSNAEVNSEKARGAMNSAISGTIASLGGLGRLGGNRPQNTPVSDIGGGGVNSVGQFSPGLATLPINLPQTFQQGLAGGGESGFGQQLGGGFGGMGGGNAFMEKSPVDFNNQSTWING